MPIRAMNKTDSERILKIDPIIFPKEIPFLKNDFNTYFSPDLSFVTYDEQDNEINGYIFAKRLGKNIFIGNFGVLEQNKGLGSQLMEAVINTAQNLYEDVPYIKLQVRKANANAIKFYQRYNFVESSSLAGPGFQSMQRPLDLKLDQRAKTTVTLLPKQSALLNTEDETLFVHLDSEINPLVEDLNKLSGVVRKDIDAVQKEVSRLRKNARSCFSFGNTTKANLIDAAMNNALQAGCEDLSQNVAVRAALGRHRLFSFFGCKKATALENVDSNLEVNFTV